MQQLYSKCKEKINAHAGLDTIRYLFNRMYHRRYIPLYILNIHALKNIYTM